jgi:hypothetical protein
MEVSMKTEEEKAKDVLRERERARKGFAVTDDEGRDPLDKNDNSIEDEEAREQKVGDAGLAGGLGLKRSG